MVHCDECDAVIEDGEEAFVFSDEHDTFVFCSESCAANFLCVIEEIDWDDEDYDDEDEDDEEDEEDFQDVDFDLNVFE